MLRGLKTKWKQVIAWHVCPKKNDPDSVYQFFQDLLVKVEGIGLKVKGILSDMGSKNLALWKHFGIKVNRKFDDHFIDHPIRAPEKLHFMADVPHLLKNLKSMFVSHEFVVDPDTVLKYNLNSNVVSSEFVKKCLEVQENLNLKMTPNLNISKLEPTNNFEKMNVGYACDVFNEQVAAAIETLVALKLLSTDALTTAWFIRLVRSWFDMFNSRCESRSISLKNMDACFQTLNEFMYIFLNLSIANVWKPVQTGVKITILSFQAIVKELLTSDKFRFVIPSRFNQDCLESLFSSLRRHGNNDPNALQAMRSLRMMTMSQFIDTRTEASNYTKDDDAHYVNLFTDKKQKTKLSRDEIENCVDTDINFESQKDRSHYNLNAVEKNSLSYFVGAAVCKVLKKHNKVICRSCISKMKSSKNSEIQNIFISCVEKKDLIYPDSLFFSLMIKIDKIINVEIDSCHTHPHLLNHLQYICKKNVIVTNYECKKCDFLNLFLNYYIHLKEIAHIKNAKNALHTKKHEKRFASRTTNRYSDVHG